MPRKGVDPMASDGGEFADPESVWHDPHDEACAEKRLWMFVLDLAFQDALGDNLMNRATAREWFANDKALQWVLYATGLPIRVKDCRARLARRGEWKGLGRFQKATFAGSSPVRPLPEAGGRGTGGFLLDG